MTKSDKDDAAEITVEAVIKLPDAIAVDYVLARIRSDRRLAG